MSIILLSSIAYGMDIIIVVYATIVCNKYLAKADNPIKYKESTDWFYEKYDANENGGTINEKY